MSVPYFAQIIVSGIVVIIGISAYKFVNFLLHSFSIKKNLSDVREKVIGRLFLYVTVSMVSISMMFIWGINFKTLWILTTGILGFLGIALFASWSYLSNVFSAFVLFFSVPYKINDRVTITDGQINISGTIDDMTLFYVFLKDEYGNSISIPNNIMLQKVVKRHLSNKESFSIVEKYESSHIIN